MLVVTRHPALIEYLIETGVITEGQFRVVAHVTVDDVRGQHVVGILPLQLAAETEKLTQVTLNLPPEMRGVELTVEDIRQYAGAIETFQVRRC